MNKFTRIIKEEIDRFLIEAMKTPHFLDRVKDRILNIKTVEIESPGFWELMGDVNAATVKKQIVSLLKKELNSRVKKITDKKYEMDKTFIYKIGDAVVEKGGHKFPIKFIADYEDKRKGIFKTDKGTGLAAVIVSDIARTLVPYDSEFTSNQQLINQIKDHARRHDFDLTDDDSFYFMTYNPEQVVIDLDIVDKMKAVDKKRKDLEDAERKEMEISDDLPDRENSVIKHEFFGQGKYDKKPLTQVSTDRDTGDITGVKKWYWINFPILKTNQKPTTKVKLTKRDVARAMKVFEKDEFYNIPTKKVEDNRFMLIKRMEPSEKEAKIALKLKHNELIRNKKTNKGLTQWLRDGGYEHLAKVKISEGE